MGTNRRTFIQRTALAGLALAAFSRSSLAGIRVFPGEKDDNRFATKNPQRRDPLSKLRIGFIGVGLRGRGTLGLALRRSDCEVPCIADPDSAAIEASNRMFERHGLSKPTAYQDGNWDYINMLEKEKLDAVIISSPWMWHTEQSVAAMKKGLYTGCEVRGAFSVDECWQLVNTHEETGSHFFFLENVDYRRDVMAVLNMVRQNLFGELIHLECGYQHDLRNVKFNDGKTVYAPGTFFGEKALSEARWRTKHSLHRNGDLYPTHGAGPVINFLDINRGNRFTTLVSMSTKSRGLQEYLRKVGGDDEPNADLPWKLGDVVTTLIQCSNGEKVLVSHDTNLPRPYSLGFRVQGTKGLWMDVNKSIHMEGTSPDHRWEDAAGWLKKYDHPLWKKYESDAAGAGHGGMDWFMMNGFVEAAKKNEAPPIDVYDAASMLAITPLSEQSIAMGNAPMTFPDFTRGRWMTKKPDFGLREDY
jgi:hypothetical protein